MLVIPIIKISNGAAVTKLSTCGCCKLDTSIPGEIAVILRGENFKAIHVSIEDIDAEARKKSFESIRDILRKVDIPLVVGAYLLSEGELAELFSLGCYRAVVNFPDQDSTEKIKNLMKAFSASKIVVRLNILNHALYNAIWEKLPFDLNSGYAFLKELGVQRVLLSCYTDKENKIIDYDCLNEIFSTTKIRNTLIGGVNDLGTLLKLIAFEKKGLDSVVIGRAIYENKFKCQLLWRENEKYLDDLGPTRRI